MSTEKIESLSKYIKALGKYSASKYLFRGEHCYIDEKDGKIKSHTKRTSGAFLQKTKDPNRRNFPSFINKVNEYYENIGHRLSEIEKSQAENKVRVCISTDVSFLFLQERHNPYIPKR